MHMAKDLIEDIMETPITITVPAKYLALTVRLFKDDIVTLAEDVMQCRSDGKLEDAQQLGDLGNCIIDVVEAFEDALRSDASMMEKMNEALSFAKASTATATRQ